MEETYLSKDHRKWRLVSDPPCGAAYNMAVDEAVLIAHAAGDVPPTLRLYQWNPPAVSIGFSQDIHREIDLDRCRQLGIDIVRRPTGGRAVLHDKELTYSVIIHTQYLPGSVLQTYKFLSQGLLAAIGLLGLPAQIASKPKHSKNPGSPACFDSPSWYEVEVFNRKLVGSAQTRRKNVLLQHGSILMELDIDKLQQVMFAPNEKVRRRLAAALEKQATAVNDELRQMGREPVQRKSIEAAIIEGFQQSFGITLQLEELTEKEKRLTKKLVEEKYDNPEWTIKRKESGEHHV